MNVTTWTVSSYESIDDCEFDEAFDAGADCGLVFAIHWAIPSFYSTLWQLTVSHDIPGLTSYISSFGSIAVVLMILLIVLTNMTGLPSVQFVTVNGILFGLLPGIVISWAGQVLGNILAFVIMRYVFRHKAQALVDKSRWLSKLNRKIDFRLIFSSGPSHIRRISSSPPSAL